MNAKLTIVKGHLAGEVFPLSFGDAVIVGRDEACNIHILDDGVSRRHFKIEGRGRSFLLSDLQSANGTYVNDEPVSSKILRQDDRINAGEVEIVFKLSAAAARESEAAGVEMTDEEQVPQIRRRIEADQVGRSTSEEHGAYNVDEMQNMLSTIYTVGNVINSENDSKKLFDTVMDSVLSVLPADRGFLILYDADTDIIEPVVIRSQDQEAGRNLNLSRTILTESVKKGLSILSSDAMKDTRFKAGASVILHNIKSAICVPLESQRKILGAIYLDSLSAAGVFTEYHLELLSAIGKQAGIAIERARLIRDLEMLFYGAIRTLIATIEAKDHYTKGHTERVTTYALQIAQELGIPESEIESLQLASLLHDVGKIGIPEKILKKPGKLTPGEYEIMKRHPTIGADIISNIENIDKVKNIVASHHEKWDGSGYTHGLKGEEIPLGARILAVADAFDAMTSTRSYRRNFSEEEVIKEFKRCAGFQFDREVVKAFFRAYQKGLIVPPDLLNVVDALKFEKKQSG
jgi:putative nucleotidyltransferase with HDIG domain